MGSVTISGSNFEIYSTLVDAQTYFKAGLGDSAVAFRAAVATVGLQEMALVEATRMLDRQRWKGEPVGVPVFDVVLQWPRTGVTDRYGDEVSSASVPDKIIKATYELAGLLLVDPGKKDAAMSGSNVASVGAGPASVSFFRPTLGVTGRFDTVIQELVGEFLGGGTRMAGEAFNNDDESQFDSTDIYGINGAT